MFVPLWVIFLSSGLIMAIFTVVWAARTRQFDDQHRARFIPLNGLSQDALAHTPKKRFLADYVGLFALLTTGFLAIVAGLFLAILHL